MFISWKRGCEDIGSSSNAEGIRGYKMRLQFEGYSSFEEVDRMVDEFASSLSCDMLTNQGVIVYNTTIVLRELLNNAVEHGNRWDINKRIIWEFGCDGKAIYIRVTDEGQGFNISRVMKEISNKDHDRERARGILLIKSLGFFIETVGNQVVAKFNINRLCEGEGDSCGHCSRG